MENSEPKKTRLEIVGQSPANFLPLTLSNIIPAHFRAPTMNIVAFFDRMLSRTKLGRQGPFGDIQRRVAPARVTRAPNARSLHPRTGQTLIASRRSDRVVVDMETDITVDLPCQCVH